MKWITVGASVLLAALSQPASAETARVNGVELHYDVRGSGKPLLLLHGFGSCAADSSGLAEAFAGSHRVISVDARGHGRSTNPDERFSHAQAAEDVRALLDALEIDQARAIGFSSGGMTLLQLATRHPRRLEKMVVVGATNEYPQQARDILQAVTAETLPPDVLAEFRQCATRGEPQVSSLIRQFQAFGFSTDDMKLGRPELAAITASTLIVHGDRDVFFPVSIPVEIYGAIEGSALWIVPEGDHSPTAGASQEDFVEVVEAFLAK